jgi:hypothetical protein
VAGDVLRDPVAEIRGAAGGEEQVEPAQDRAVVGDEHVVGADAGLLLGQQGPVPVGEPVEVLIAAVVDEGGEVGTVRQLESQDRVGVVSTQLLQLGHRPTLPSGRAVRSRPPSCANPRRNRR